MWNVRRVITLSFIVGLTAMTACTKKDAEQAAVDPNVAEPTAQNAPASPPAATPEGFAAATSKEVALVVPALLASGSLFCHDTPPARRTPLIYCRVYCQTDLRSDCNAGKQGAKPLSHP